MYRGAVLAPLALKSLALGGERARHFWIVADAALLIRLPLSAPSSSRADAAPTGVKQQG